MILKVNVFGTLKVFHEVVLNPFLQEKLNQYCAKHKMNMTEAILDLGFYTSLKNKRINNYKDISKPIFKGIEAYKDCKIEMWYQNKKIWKLRGSELNNEAYLFPMFNLSIKDGNIKSKCKYVVITEEVGKVFHLLFDVSELNIDHLSFSFKRIFDRVYFDGVFYNNRVPKNLKTDTLITGSHAVNV